MAREAQCFFDETQGMGLVSKSIKSHVLEALDSSLSPAGYVVMGVLALVGGGAGSTKGQSIPSQEI